MILRLTQLKKKINLFRLINKIMNDRKEADPSVYAHMY